MFRNAVSEMSLFGSGRNTVPKPSFKPALEALEERIVLSAATGRLLVSAKALPHVNPAVATRKVVHTITTSVKQFVLLQDRLVALAAQMGKRPAGAARQPFVLQAQKLIAKFLKQENTRALQFHALAKRVARSALFAVTKRLFTLVHRNVLLVNRQTVLFRWASYTTFAARNQNRRIHAAPPTVARSARNSDDAPQLTPADADFALLELASIVNRFERPYPPIPTDPLAARVAEEVLNEYVAEAVAITFLGLVVADKYASPDGASFFKDAVGPILRQLYTLQKQAEANANVNSSSFFPAHVTPCVPPPSLPLPPDPLP